jgi:thiamine-phosphate pyrophosphorylase
VIEAALAAGFDMVQLRDPGAGAAAVLAAARALRPVTRRHRARLVVNDRLDVALAADADGAHLPAASFPVASARALLGPGRLIGRSTHAPAEVVAAARDGADYVVLGPAYATPSKARWGAPLGLEPLREAAAVTRVPIVAIGGITAERGPAVLAAGASGVAVIGAVFDAADPAAAAAAIVRAIAGGRPDAR